MPDDTAATADAPANTEATTTATTATTATTQLGAGRGLLFLGVGVVLLALNLRPALVAVSPLTDTIRADSGMSATATSLLTALPLLCFGLLAPLAPRIGRRLGVERALLATMALVGVGTALRLLDSVVALFAGTVVIGAGIAVANVLLPGLIKRDFPGRAGLMTGLYSMSLFAGAALAAGITVPVQHAAGLSWRTTLACWGALALVAAVVWLPQARRRTAVPVAAAGQGPGRCAVCGARRWPGRSPRSWDCSRSTTTRRRPGCRACSRTRA